MISCLLILFTVPNRAPTDVVPFPDRRSINVSWSAIECIHQNGRITGYDVEFQQADGTAVIDGEVVNMTFTASGLQPFTDYIFRVAGVNSDGSGTFTDAVTIQTYEDGT